MKEKRVQNLAQLVPSEISDVFKAHFGFENFTKVQRVACENLLAYKDVIIQAPTGSGKTLAYVMPLFALLRKVKKDWSKNEIGALILVPSRELALQVAEVCRPFADAFEMTLGTYIGGKHGKKKRDNAESIGASVVVATPGRFQQMIEADDVKKALKSLEFLVVDEADRFIELGFKQCISEILAVLPKQRRTGLFSATQAKEIEELVSFGLRNPILFTISDENRDSSAQLDVTPASLQNYFAVVNGDEKLAALVEFIRNQPDAKILVFFSTCKCVVYMRKILASVLTKRKLLALHGKKKHSRNSELDIFRKTPKSVLFSTDVLSRGIDVPDIDWVIQFDIPKQSSWFIHRSGRSGRCGREGKSLLLISPEQEAYTQFLQKYEKVTLEKIKIPTLTALKANQLREKIIKLASSDRDILEKGTEAFVSFVESYLRHDCNVVCPLDDLDVVGHAHAYALLRMPRMKEFKNRDFSSFKRVDIDTSTIAYKEKAREKERLEKRLKRNQKAEGTEDQEKTDNSDAKSKVVTPELIRKRKRRDQAKEKKDWEELADDIALLKKFKGGRLGKKELSEKFVC